MVEDLEDREGEGGVTPGPERFEEEEEFRRKSVLVRCLVWEE